ncbi:MAG: amino acid adenylation domain-containing protein, partial [Trebonia sp.]
MRTDIPDAPGRRAVLPFTAQTLAGPLHAIADRERTSATALLAAGFQALLHRYTDHRYTDHRYTDHRYTGGPDATAPDPDPGDMTLPELARAATMDPAGTYRVSSPGLSLLTGPDDRVPRGSIEYDPGTFDAEFIGRLPGHLTQLIEDAIASPQIPVRRLRMLTPAEERQFGVWNATAIGYPADALVPELISRQAAATPDRPALVFERRVTSFSEVDERSGQLAHFMAALGAGPGEPVCVYLDRSPELVIAAVAVLKSGSAYLPIDPDYPAARVAYMIADSRAGILITRSDLARQLPPVRATVIELDTDRARIASQPARPPSPASSGADLSYVIYTSGSTGKPKGAMNTHRGLLNRIQWMQETYQLTPEDAVIAKTPCGFDVSMWELTWPLMTGARVILPRPGGQGDPRYLADLIETEKVTIAHFVPSMLRIFVDTVDFGKLGSLRQVLSGGEALSADLRDRFFSASDRIALDNLYGPAEAAIDVTRWACRPGDPAVPIGRPIANTTVHVLDRWGNQVPIGLPGELHVGGVQVAHGYLHRPGLTAEKFIADPFSAEPGARLYATGDLARWRADGVLEYLGRLDDQVKVRGQRVEPGEIESVLREHGNVTEAAVVQRDAPSGEPALVAYVQASGSGVSQAELRAWLERRLPGYMVPAFISVIETLPLSPNGKLDHAALRARPLPAPDTGYVPPANPLELRVAGIWTRVLGLRAVGRGDDFFALGGHSLNAVSVIAAIADEFGVTIPLSAIFAVPVLGDFVAACVAPRIEAREGGNERPEAGPVRSRETRAAPLSSAQRRLWFLDQMYPHSAAYHIPLAWRLRGPLNVSALRQALTELLRRHEVLRSRIIEADDGDPVQVPTAPAAAALPLTDVPEVTEELLRARTAVRFDLRAGPLLRAELFRTSGAHHVLLIVVHHIAADEWTIGLLESELAELYSALAENRPGRLEDPPAQYGDYALWERDALTPSALSDLAGFWTAELAGAQPIDLPIDRPRPPVPSFAGRRARATVPAPLMERLRGEARAQSGTDFMIMAAGLQALLSRYTGQDDLTIGTVTANRPRRELESVAGFFVNTLPLRVDLSGQPSFAELLGRVREAALRAFEHQEMPFDELVRAVAP